MSVTTEYKQKKANLLKRALKGKAQNVSVVNTPTVKIDHSSDKPKPEPPTLRLTSKDLPDVEKWKVGSKYKLQLEVEQIGSRQGQDYIGGLDSESSDNGKVINATFKVTSVKAV